MIFLTVGVQLPFDRLVKAVDEWAMSQDRSDIVAQVGETSYQPKRLDARSTLSGDEFRQFVEAADLVIGHAGMGSIITALELGKRIIVMPRRADLGEHRNDHQLATARHMAAQNVVSVAEDETELVVLLNELKPDESKEPIPPHASDTLLNLISKQINEAPVRPRWMPWSRRA